ncbi:hypothetical protein AAFX91_26020 [Bradyrhizobium sp. 31Argb]|uniref:hypothetical protein n=1 Tax=unclassified Bradyrhizobium TaxID=2631580 RepID=UPI00102ED222|nr:hypothetical protein [Bradyrhizobium sp. Leo170]TAI61016.1 hypothetical protein CWO89_37550 [Bradyrhizobium sp. Leo170]
MVGSGARIRNGTYTDADILALYMKYREAGIGPFTREIGDFIAHSRRDRGATLDTTAYVFAQVAFFQTYQSDKKRPLEPKGKCGWWLKHYFLTKAKEANEAELLKHADMTKKQAKNAIESWFDDKSAYPMRINCKNPNELYRLATLFCRTIVGKNVFDLDAVKLEIKQIFQKEGIPQTEMDDFIIGTCVLLSGKSAEIVPGFAATVELAVGTTRSIPTGKDGRWPGDPNGWNVIPLPDGNLTVCVKTKNETGDGLVSIALELLDTKIDTEAYFSRSLITKDQHGFPCLDFDAPLSFDATANPKVSIVV